MLWKQGYYEAGKEGYCVILFKMKINWLRNLKCSKVNIQNKEQTVVEGLERFPFLSLVGQTETDMYEEAVSGQWGVEVGGMQNL